MNLYPLNLVLAVAIGSALLFFGNLSPRQLAVPFFTQRTIRFGGLWLLLAAFTPPEILHYYLLLALICFAAWWQLLDGQGLIGKLCLCLAAGLGISLGPVLILAVTPGVWPDAQPAWAQVLFLVSLYSGGGIAGLAFALWLFTRPEALDANVRTAGLARLLLAFILVRAVVGLGAYGFVAPTGPARPLTWHFFFQKDVIIFVFFVVVLFYLARVAGKRLGSPRPSTAAPALLSVVFLGILAEAWSLLG